jgi:hypothetical protein
MTPATKARRIRREEIVKGFSGLLFRSFLRSAVLHTADAPTSKKIRINALL